MKNSAISEFISSRTSTFVAGTLSIFIILQTILLVKLNINWDEYFFLSHINAYRQGLLTDPMQTFHVRLLGFLAELPLADPDRIIAGRLFMFLCEVGSLYAVYRIARCFVDHEAALFAPLAWCTAGYALAYGMSFRTDPLAAFLMLGSLALLFGRPHRWWLPVVAGSLAALGIVITIKSVLYLPAFAAAFAWRWRDPETRRETVATFLMAGLVAAMAASALWLYHGSTLPSAGGGTGAGFAETTAGVRSQSNYFLDKVILSQGWFPRTDYIARWAMISAIPLLPILGGISEAGKRLLHGDRLGGLSLLLLAAPLLSLAVYRNAFPYFFPFILFPVAVLAGAAASRLRGTLVREAILAGMLITLILQFSVNIQRDQSAQRSVAEAVRNAFPHPVPYIDRNGMIPSFPKAGFFMSTWGVEGILASGKPALVSVIENQEPPLVIANTPVLEAALNPDFASEAPMLHDGDVAALRDNYVRHWGPIWVAGKRIGSTAAHFTVVISGVYTLECKGERQIDGTTHPCGSTLHLAEGGHRWGGGAAVLRWGDHLAVPAQAPPRKPIYYGF